MKISSSGKVSEIDVRNASTYWLTAIFIDSVWRSPRLRVRQYSQSEWKWVALHRDRYGTRSGLDDTEQNSFCWSR